MTRIAPSRRPETQFRAGQTTHGAWCWLTWVARCVVFLGIPFLLLGLATMRWQHAALVSAREQARSELRQTLAQLRSEAEAHPALERLLSGMAPRVLRAMPEPRAQRMLADLHRRYPGVFRFTVLDAEGNPVAALCDGVPSRTVARRLFAAFQELRRGRSDLWHQHRSLFTAFLGKIDIERAEPSAHAARGATGPFGRLLVANGHGEGTYVFLSTPAPEGMVVVQLANEASWERRCLVDRVAQHRIRARLHPDRAEPVQVELIDVADIELPRVARTPVGQALATRLGLSASELDGVLCCLLRDQLPVVAAAGRYWSVQPVAPHEALLGSVRIPPIGEGSFALHETPTAPSVAGGRAVTPANTVPRILWLTVFVVVGLGYRLLSGRSRFSLSVRFRLTLLFACTAGVPLLVTLLVATGYVKDLRATRETALHQDHEDLLRGFDTGFRSYLADLGERLARSIAPASSTADLTVAKALAQVEALRAKFRPDRAQVFDAAGRDLCATVAGPRMASMPRSILPWPAMVRTELRALNADLVPDQAGSRSAESQSEFSRVASEQLEGTFKGLMHNLRGVSVFVQGGRTAFVFAHPLTDAAGSARFLVILEWSELGMKTSYLRSQFLTLQRRLPSARLVVACRTDARNDLPERPRPRWLVLAMRRLEQQSGRLWASWPGRGDARLVTAISGVELGGFDVLAITTDRSISTEVADLQYGLGAAVVALLLLGGAGGAVLARRILQPIGVLAGGVASLQRREFRWRGQSLADDELGELTTAFNSMMEGLEDLEIGRVVQENLFPARPLSFPGGAVFGSCVAASQMGGDYFDYFLTPANSVALVFGDVAGHGVAAALVMGMAKALVDHPGTSPEPGAVVAVLNRVLHGTLGRRGMMTLWVANLDLATQCMTYCSAGQTSPLLVREGRATFLDQPGLPLAARSEARYRSATCPLRPGDRLVCYSDGLPESLLPSGEQIGYARLAEALPGLLGANPEDTVTRLRDWHRQTAHPGPQADDITITALHLDQVRAGA